MESKYCILYLKSNQTVVARREGPSFFSANLDQVDPDGFSSCLGIHQDSIAVVEDISEQRFSHMREMAIARVRTQHIQTIIALQQIVEQGRKFGIVTDNKQPENDIDQPQKKQGPKMTVLPKEEEALSEPVEAQKMPMNPKIVGEKQDYDGVVIEVPSPGMKN